MAYYRSTSLLIFVLLLAAQSAVGQFGGRQFNQTGYSHIGTDFWASGGAGIAEPGIPGAAFGNPALLRFNAPTARVEFGWRPVTDYTFAFDYQYDNTLALPSYASVGIPIGPYNIEAGYARTYDERFSLAKAEYVIFTISNGNVQTDHTGRYVDVTNTISVHTAFAAMAYTLPQNISVGVMVGKDFIRYESSSINTVVQTGSRLRFSVGGVAQPWKDVSVAVCASILPKTTSGISSTPLPGVLQVNSGPLLVALYPTSYFSWQSPSSLTIGTGVEVSPWLTFLGSVEYQTWSSGIDLSDRWQFHAGGIATIVPGITLRAGFFTQTSASVGGNDYLDENFLTGGVSCTISPSVTASLSYLTSAPFVRSVRWMTYKSLNQKLLSGGISYSW